MAEEIELKIAIARAQQESLLKSPGFRALNLKFTPARRLTAVYFDTKKHRLAQDGITVRLRREGKAIVQTVKTASDAVLARRGEWNDRVDHFALDPKKLSETGLKALSARAAKDKLKPVFETNINRRIAVLDDGAGQTLELAFDRGDISAGRRVLPVCEFELELKSGTPDFLFDWARRLCAMPGAMPAVASKSARGFALARGVHHAPSKASPVTLERGISASEAAGAVIDACLVHALAAAPEVTGKDASDAIHQLRVALRRLRAALVLFKSVLPEDAAASLKQGAASLAAGLGPARDLDVFLGGTLQPAARKHARDPGFAQLLRLTLAMRRRARAAAAAAMRSPAPALLFVDAAHLAARLRAPDAEGAPLAPLASKLLAKRYAAAAELGLHLSELSVPDRHRLRIALKKLRYAIEFFQSLFPEKQVRPALKSLAALQDVFGVFNDASHADTLLDKALAASGRAPPEALNRAALYVRGWSAHRADISWAEAEARWRAFASAPRFWA